MSLFGNESGREYLQCLYEVHEADRGAYKQILQEGSA